MASRHKKYLHTNKHGHEKQSRVILEGDKAHKPRLEVDENRRIQKSPITERDRQPFSVGNMYSLNSAMLAAKRIEEFRNQK